MARWIYRLSNAGSTPLAARSDEAAAVVEERADYLRALKGAGILILAGEPRPEAEVWAVTIIQTPDEASARAVMQTDPAVSSGLMNAALHPYALGAATD